MQSSDMPSTCQEETQCTTPSGRKLGDHQTSSRRCEATASRAHPYGSSLQTGSQVLKPRWHGWSPGLPSRRTGTTCLPLLSWPAGQADLSPLLS